MKSRAVLGNIVSRYGALAGVYDRRWRRYTQRTAAEAVEALRMPEAGCGLDVGCGTGEFMRRVKGRWPAASWVGVDLVPAMLAVAQRKCAGLRQARFLAAGAEWLPFASGAFDAVVSLNMLHHVETPEQFLAECQRILRPGGQLVVVDWCRDFWHCRLAHGWYRLTDRTYVRMYRLGEVASLLAQAGFAADGARRFVAFPAYGMMRICARRPAWSIG